MMMMISAGGDDDDDGVIIPSNVDDSGTVITSCEVFAFPFWIA